MPTDDAVRGGSPDPGEAGIIVEQAECIDRHAHSRPGWRERCGETADFARISGGLAIHEDEREVGLAGLESACVVAYGSVGILACCGRPGVLFRD